MILDDFGPLALERVLGRSAFQRHLHHAARLGVRTVTVRFGSAAGDERARATLRDEIFRQAAEMGDGAPAVAIEADAPPATASASGSPDPAGEVLVVRAAAIFDPRLYDAITRANAPAVLVDDRSGDGTGAPVGLTLVPRCGAPPEEERPAVVPLSGIPTYLASLRRELPPWWRQIRSRADLAAAGERLLDATQKGVLDFPARYLHPAPENALARWLAGTHVTPNQVTVLTGVLGLAAAVLFGMQWFGEGLALAFLVNVLDGVDGKLARVKLMASRFGDRLDHTLDVSFEFAWYLGIGWGLAAAEGATWPITYALALIAVMLGCRGVSGLYRLATGRQIHDHTPFDRAFRLVAGRRNIYTLVLLAGWLAGGLAVAFRVVLAWALVTLAVYTLRTVAAAGRRATRAAG